MRYTSRPFVEEVCRREGGVVTVTSHPMEDSVLRGWDPKGPQPLVNPRGLPVSFPSALIQR
jgi:hypothetical protein